MSDIFREIDEEVRREQLRRLWERYGIFIIAVAVLAVIAVAGWRIYEYRQDQSAAATSTRFEAAAALAREDKTKEATEAFAAIAADGSSATIYRTLAAFREAAEQAGQDPKVAIAAYDKLAADGGLSPVLRDLATLRAGELLVDTVPYDDLKARLEPLTAPARAFRHSARAVLALAAWRAKDIAVLRQWSDMILADSETPAGTRGQIQMLLALADTDTKS